jgi:nitrogen fixation-related uncharacterized protein
MTKVAIVREWLLIVAILLGAVGIIAAGWAYHLEQLDDVAEEQTVADLTALVQSNQAMLTALTTKPNARPLAFDACAGTDLVEAMRQKGIEVPPQEFEARCQAVRKP